MKGSSSVAQDLLRYITYLSSHEDREKANIISSQLNCHEVTLMVVRAVCSHLLLHLLDLPDRAAALGTFFMP